MLDLDVRSDYSPDLRLRLDAEGRSWPLSKLGPDHFVPAKRFELAPCDGVIVMSIDGDEHRWPVRVVHGVCPIDDSVEIRYYKNVNQRIQE